MEVHIAGLVITTATHQRQRCAWCGMLLTEYELALTAVAILSPDDDTTLPSWPVGRMVAIDGGMSWCETRTDPEAPPDPELWEASCLNLDPEVTL